MALTQIINDGLNLTGIPTGAIKYIGTSELSANTGLTTTSTSFTSTGASITIPSATVANLSSIVIFAEGAIRINKNTHAIADVQIQRTAPSAVTSYTANVVGVVSGGSEVYDQAGSVVFDTNLGSGDHTYTVFIRKASGVAAYAGSIYYRNSGWRLIALGL